MADNSLHKSVVDNINLSNILVKRILAFLLDILIIGILGAILSYLIELIYGETFLLDFVFYLVLIVVVLKDLATKDGSFGKQKLKLKIVTSYGSNHVSIIRKIARNITIIIWPVEFLVLLFSGKKIMDYLLKINVVSS